MRQKRTKHICLVKSTKPELLSMFKPVLEEFSIPELCRLLPAEGLTDLIKEVRYFAEDGIIGTLQSGMLHA